MKRLDQLVFNNTFRQLPDVFGQAVTPIGLDNAFLVSANPEVAALLELNPEELQIEGYYWGRLSQIAGKNGIFT